MAKAITMDNNSMVISNNVNEQNLLQFNDMDNNKVRKTNNQSDLYSHNNN